MFGLLNRTDHGSVNRALGVVASLSTPFRQ